MSFGIPDRDAEISALAIDGRIRAEAWQVAIEQAETLEACNALAERLHKRLDLLRSREACPAVERRALAMIGDRITEILAKHPA